MKLTEVAEQITRAGDDQFKKYGMNAFAEAAKNILEKSNLPDIFNYEELVETMMKQDFKVHQSFRSFEFSDLPLTLSRGEHCFLDIYFWRRRPTVIHDHHFSGAFQCLQGLNVDSVFSYRTDVKFGNHHSMGQLRLLETRQLRKGDVVSIAPLDKFIHQNHHQADLTVNVCLRIPELKGEYISNYIWGGLKWSQEPLLLSRIDRLLRFISMQSFSTDRINFSLDEAIQFLIKTHGTSSQISGLLTLRETLSQKLVSELNLNIPLMLDEHEREMDLIQESYD